MNLHPRSEWYDPATWQSHATFDPRLVVGIAWHYPGADHLRTLGADDVYQLSDTVAMLRAMDRDYRTTRAYNLGYSFVIDGAGEVWTVRGLTDRPASNGNQATNSAYPGVLFLVPDLNSKPSAAQLGAACELVALIRGWAHGARVNVPHSHLFVTACPGDVIRELLATLEPPATPSPAAPYLEEPDMAQARFRHPDYANVFVMPEGTPESEQLDHAFSALPMTVEPHEPVLAACIFRSWGITGATTGEAIARARDGGYLVPIGPH